MRAANPGRPINATPTGNVDTETVEGFGDEWSRFDQSGLSRAETEEIFASYFSVFPWHQLPKDAVGFDLGCGSGRWAKLVAPRVGTLHCIDASADALAVAKRNLAGQSNCEFHRAAVDAVPLSDSSCDFGYSLGVLHHVPDTLAGLRSCVSKLKPGAPFLLYLYYAMENRAGWYRKVWSASELIRKRVSRMPMPMRFALSQCLAAGVYFPLARTAKVLEKLGADVESIPLAYYRDRSFYTMRTDALDRFGTRLEQRFTRSQIDEMMRAAGLEQIRFREDVPYWCAVGLKRDRQ